MPCETTRALLRIGVPPTPEHVTRCDGCTDLRGRSHLVIPEPVAPTPRELARAYRSRQVRRAAVGLAAAAMLGLGGAAVIPSRTDDPSAEDLAALVDALDALHDDGDPLLDPLPGDVLAEAALDGDVLDVPDLFGEGAWP
jgi:hypothetical protein